MAAERESADAVAAADTHLSEYEAGNNADSEVRYADGEDAELEAMKQRVAEMEAEAAKLREMNDATEQGLGGAGSAFPTEEEKLEIDGRSVYVGNVRPLAHAGRLWRNARGNPAAFPELWYDQPCHDPL